MSWTNHIFKQIAWYKCKCSYACNITLNYVENRCCKTQLVIKFAVLPIFLYLKCRIHVHRKNSFITGLISVKKLLEVN